MPPTTRGAARTLADVEPLLCGECEPLVPITVPAAARVVLDMRTEAPSQPPVDTIAPAPPSGAEPMDTGETAASASPVASNVLPALLSGPSAAAASALPAIKRGTRVRLDGLVSATHLNKQIGFVTTPPSSFTHRYNVIMEETGEIVLVLFEKLKMEETGDDDDDQDFEARSACLLKRLGITRFLDGTVVSDSTNPNKDDTINDPKQPSVSLLASLAPVVFETIDGAEVEGTYVYANDVGTYEDFEYADIDDADTCVENRILWKQVLDDTIKRTVSVLINHGLLGWDDILEDGNLFWEIAFTDTPEWPEPDRWVETVCNFLQLLAWERTMLSKTSKLYPTVRLQIMRDLYIREWQERSRRLGRELFALFFPEELTASTSEAQRVATEKLSAYEQERNQQVLENQAMLASLGIMNLVQQQRNQRQPAKKPKERRADVASTSSAAPTRASARVATQPLYFAPPQQLASDDDGEEGESGEEGSSGDEAYIGGDESDASAMDEAVHGGAAASRSGGKAKVVPRAPTKPKRKSPAKTAAKPAKEGPRQKKLQSCGKQATILPGGRGLVCPLEGCTVVGTEAEVLAHALKEHGIQGRVVGANGRTRCLWEGCGKCVKLSKQRDGSWNLGHVRQHERKHAPGPNPYVVPDTVLPGRENKTGRVPAIFRVPASAPSAAP